MIKLFSLALLPFYLLAEITTSSIASHHASYDGNGLVLRGNVHLDHTLGKMESATARLVREDSGGPFSHIQLQDQVKILLKNHGHATCYTADFDFKSMAGELLARKGGKVEFANLAKGINLWCSGAQVFFTDQLGNMKITKLVAHSSVDVEYDQDFSLKADSAIYFNDPVCMIEAAPNCSLAYLDHYLQADKIQIYPDSSKVVLEAPRANLKPKIFSDMTNVFFSCDNLTWEKSLQKLTLQGHIFIEDRAIGTIESDDQVQVKQQLCNQKRMIVNAIAKGNTKLCYQGREGNVHTLVSPGTVNFDKERFLLTAEGTEDAPITYLHRGIKLEADRAQLHYTEAAGTLSPEKLLLSGTIRLTSEESLLRCGVADQFIYHPDTKEMILLSQNDERVLFWDEQQHLSISAKEIHITRTPQGESIKGVENVRFAFSSIENALLKKLFPFYQPPGGNL